MRHSVFAGGKRLRPILCMEAARMVAGCVPKASKTWAPRWRCCTPTRSFTTTCPRSTTTTCAAAVRPAHKVFGEAIAILAGDALQTYAYEVLAKLQCPAEARVAIIAEIAHATGTIDGMIGGQVMDLEAEHTHRRRENAGVHSSLQDRSAAHRQRGHRRNVRRRRRRADPEPARLRHEHRAGVPDRR